MRRRLRRPFLLLTAFAMLFASRPALLAARTPLAATFVDIDLTSGAIRVDGPDRKLASAPGSTLKPMVLLTALRRGIVTPQTKIACRGTLRVASRNLACAHPSGIDVLDAEEALAYSCNTYFANVARLMPSSALQAGLARYGVNASQPPRTPEERILLALGVEGVSVTPLQLAHAYAELAKELSGATGPETVVRRGLLGSVTFGMAHGAQTPGLLVGGKTGTAHDAVPLLQHGWFAGIVFASSGRPLHIVVVYAPGGNGNDAAIAAHDYLQHRRW